MTKEEAIKRSKEFRVELDRVLQMMKGFRVDLLTPTPRPKPTIEELERLLAQEGDKNVCVRPDGEVDVATPLDGWANNPSEAIAQHTISIRDLESAIMRQGMMLKNIGNPTPYPDSYKPENSIVNPTADGLKL